MTATLPIRPKSIPETLAERIRAAILAGQLSPGERLIELKLASAYGVGQPTVREALKELEIQGFVRKSANRGTYVTELSAEDMRKMFEVRMTLETLAIERATQQLTDESLAELEECLAEMQAAADAVDLAGFHQADANFHRKLWALSGNEHLAAALDRITFALFAFVILRQKDDAPSYQASVEKHRRILEAMATRDPQHARRVFEEDTRQYWVSYQHIDD